MEADPEYYDEVWVTTDMLSEAIKPINDNIEECQAAEDALFEHVRNILQLQESMESQRYIAKLRHDMAGMIMQSTSKFHDMSSKNIEAWKTKFTCDIIGIVSQGNAGNENLTKDVSQA